MTEYVILSKPAQENSWTEIGSAEAVGDQDAIRKLVANLPEPEGEIDYVAVPRRSFQVRRATTKTKTVVSFEKVEA
jgi:hypothetical protein